MQNVTFYRPNFDEITAREAFAPIREQTQTARVVQAFRIGQRFSNSFYQGIKKILIY